nr:hypothetical protein [Candidatus Sigynarchaeota archaeon]
MSRRDAVLFADMCTEYVPYSLVDVSFHVFTAWINIRSFTNKAPFASL